MRQKAFILFVKKKSKHKIIYIKIYFFVKIILE